MSGQLPQLDFLFFDSAAYELITFQQILNFFLGLHKPAPKSTLMETSTISIQFEKKKFHVLKIFIKFGVEEKNVQKVHKLLMLFLVDSSNILDNSHLDLLLCMWTASYRTQALL